MAKTQLVGAFHAPLTAILGTRAKVVALRELWASAAPLSCQEIARRGGMAFRSIDLALNDLLLAGVVERVGGRRERLVRISAGHRLSPALAALLRAEADFYPAIRSELAADASESERSDVDEGQSAEPEAVAELEGVSLAFDTPILEDVSFVARGLI